MMLTRFKHHKHNITWFNLPLSSRFKTNIERISLNSVHKNVNHFPMLKKIFNKNVTVRYSCTKNIDQYTSQHNNVILNKHLTNLQDKHTPTIKESNC